MTTTTIQLPTYQNLFGSDAYYTVPSERSVLSPAAYFVALMGLVHDEITLNPDADQSYALSTRRPDLWQKTLDAENTDQIVSKLSLVNDVLAQSSDLSGVYPLNLPYNPAFYQMTQSLSAQDISLFDLLYQVGAIGLFSACDKINKRNGLAALEMTSAAWDLCKSPASTTDLPKYYGGKLPATGSSMPVDDFLAIIDLSYETFNALIQSSGFVQTGGATFAISNQTISWGSTVPLDLLQRLLRLANGAGWSPEDTNIAVLCVGEIMGKTGENIIDDNVLPYLGLIQLLRKQYSFSMDQITAMLIGNASFFVSVFGALPNLPANFLQWNLSWTPFSGHKADTQIENVLCAGFDLSKNELRMITQMFAWDSAETLSVENLGLIYRAAVLPKAFGLEISQCRDLKMQKMILPSDEVVVLAGAFDAAEDNYLTIDSILALAEFAKWFNKTPFSAQQLNMILSNSYDLPAFFGMDRIENFCKDLTHVLGDVLLTEQRFADGLGESLFQALVAYSAAQTTPPYTAETLRGKMPDLLSAFYNQLVTDAFFGRRYRLYNGAI